MSNSQSVQYAHREPVSLPKSAPSLLDLVCCSLGLALSLCSLEVWRSPVMTNVDSSASGYTQLFALAGIAFAIAVESRARNGVSLVPSIANGVLMGVALYLMLVGEDAQSSSLMTVMSQSWAFFGYVVLAGWARFILGSGKRFSLLALTGAFLAATFLQLAVNLFLDDVLPPFASIMPVFSVLLMVPTSRLRDNRREDNASQNRTAPIALPDSVPSGFWSHLHIALFAAVCGILLKTLHETWVPLQQLEGVAYQIQLFSAIGSLIAALGSYLVMQRAREDGSVSLCATLLTTSLLLGFALRGIGGEEAPLLDVAVVNAAQRLVMLLLFLSASRAVDIRSRMLTFLGTLFAFRFLPSDDMFRLVMPNGFLPATLELAVVPLSLAAVAAMNIVLAAKTSSPKAPAQETLPHDRAAGDTSHGPHASPFGLTSGEGDLADAALSRLAKEKRLTLRERDVLPYLAQGLNAKQISDALVISEATAKTHIRNIYQKLEVHSRTEMLDLLDES